jgi:hypothetical protein
MAEMADMRHPAGHTLSALGLGCAALLGCDERDAGRSAHHLTEPKLAASNSARAAPSAPVLTHSPAPLEALNTSEIPAEASAEPAKGAPGSARPSKLIVDRAQEIGPAGQMTASEQGVVMVDRNAEIQIARRIAAVAASRAVAARFGRVRGGSGDFFAVARGPLLLRKRAYWVQDGKLVRRALDNATPLEILASDARNGTRVAGAELHDAPANAFYISSPIADEAPRAKLWVEGAGTVDVSPEGAGASSIAVASTGQALFAVAIDARSAMTPVHGRSVRFNGGKPELGGDVVLWVGSTSQTLSEVFASWTPWGVRAFLPIERDTSHFGLVMLALGSVPAMDPEAVWRGYPNGIDVAPVASAAFCGSAFVAYVRPETPSPEAREVLEIAEITEAGLGAAQLVDSARGFANLSLAAATDSAVLAYVADFRTFATTLRCTHH